MAVSDIVANVGENPQLFRSSIFFKSTSSSIMLNFILIAVQLRFEVVLDSRFWRVDLSTLKASAALLMLEN